eukprot:g4381.t1
MDSYEESKNRLLIDNSDGSINVTTREKEQKDLDEEHFLLKLLCMFSYVFPVYPSRWTKHATLKFILWAIWPLIGTVEKVTGIYYVISHTLLSEEKEGISSAGTFATLSYYIFTLLVPLALTKSRKAFKTDVVKMETTYDLMPYITCGLVYTLGMGILNGYISDAFTKDPLLQPDYIFYIAVPNLNKNSFILTGCIFNAGSFAMTALLVVRSVHLTSKFKTKQEKLLDLAKGTDASKLHKMLVDTKDEVLQSSNAYIETPLRFSILSGVPLFVFSVLRLYYPDIHSLEVNVILGYSSGVIFVTIAILSPMVALMRINTKSVQTRKALSYNLSMEESAALNVLLTSFDDIMPRAQVFGISVTNGRVGPLVLGFVSVFLPKLIFYIKDNFSP